MTLLKTIEAAGSCAAALIIAATAVYVIIAARHPIRFVIAVALLAEAVAIGILAGNIISG